MKLRRFRYIAVIIIALLIVSMALTEWHLQANIIDHIRINLGDSHYVNLQIPFLYVRVDRRDVLLFNGNPAPPGSSRVNAPISLEGQNLGQVRLEFSLLDGSLCGRSR